MSNTMFPTDADSRSKVYGSVTDRVWRAIADRTLRTVSDHVWSQVWRPIRTLTEGNVWTPIWIYTVRWLHLPDMLQEVDTDG